MKKFVLLIFFLPALSKNEKKKKNPASLAKAITPDDLKNHLYTIAGKEMEGRGTPSAGLDRAAGYIDQILRGAKVADLPFQEPTRLTLSINLSTARSLRIAVPPSLVARAEDVIE